MRVAATTLSESVVVLNEGMVHVRSSGSTTFFSKMSVMRTPNLPKSTVLMFPSFFTSSSVCPSCATNRDRSSPACALMMGAICVENSSNKAVSRRADVIFFQHLFTEGALDDPRAPLILFGTCTLEKLVGGSGFGNCLSSSGMIRRGQSKGHFDGEMTRR